ncbi:psychosine receptor isoform X3 [Mustela erminea]|uniref:psychosine receptor isoform X3 n=1 Tax=Mustela erminea TaxID=36723 RepID=UPI0013866BEE|nr:psychosine receptor isoform X3 [Mustela erminea]
MELLKISQRLNALKCPAVWVSFSSRCKQIYPAPRWTRSSPQETWEASYLQTELRVCEAVYQLPAVQASRTISWLFTFCVRIEAPAPPHMCYETKAC